jgi:acetolactate decarboxylase
MFLLIPAVIYQVSAFEALRVGNYDGTYQVSGLTRHGDFGVGTFNRLDGEMVVLGGQVFQIDGFGDARAPRPGTETPFAFVTTFRPKTSFSVAAPMTSQRIQAEIDKRFPSGILAIRIHARFTALLARSFAPQHRPYLPFARIGDRQSMLRYGTAEGDLVGFRMPSGVGALNVPGYHFHFISSDRAHGGHVLVYGIQKGVVELMPVSKIVQLPTPISRG